MIVDCKQSSNHTLYLLSIYLCSYKKSSVNIYLHGKVNICLPRLDIIFCLEHKVFQGFDVLNDFLSFIQFVPKHAIVLLTFQILDHA